MGELVLSLPGLLRDLPQPLRCGQNLVGEAARRAAIRIPRSRYQRPFQQYRLPSALFLFHGEDERYRRPVLRGNALAPTGIFLSAGTTRIPTRKFRARHLMVLAVPIATILISASNPLHHDDPQLFLLSCEVVYGPYFYVHTLYSFALVFAGAWFFLSFSKRTSGLVSFQSRLIIAGALIPVLQATGVIFSFFLPTSLQRGGLSDHQLLFGDQLTTTASWTSAPGPADHRGSYLRGLRRPKPRRDCHQLQPFPSSGCSPQGAGAGRA